MSGPSFEIGMIGLGVMGRNLLLNIADHGFTAAGYDRDPEKAKALGREAKDRRIAATASFDEFAGMLRRPRAALLLVPAGAPVDAVLGELTGAMDAGDLVIDGGNSHFTDTNRRGKELASKGILFLGMGVSGGEAGARHGPSLMPGGSKEAYERVRKILESTAAKVDGDPCVAYLGDGSAGHYVKMVHNGIEYGLMQLLSEAYDFLHRGLGLGAAEIAPVFDRWNDGRLRSFLVEITARILPRKDEKTGKPLVDVILDAARQKGTGKWTCQDAMELQVPVPVIDAAVGMRDLSGLKEEREKASSLLPPTHTAVAGGADEWIEDLERSLFFAMIVTYAQGFALLRAASAAYGYRLYLPDVARIWRGGCIIRADLLETIRAAFGERPELANLMVHDEFAARLGETETGARRVARAALDAGLPAPGLGAAIAYFDGYRSPRLPANLVQAQRDFFGSHTYERIDAKGVFHTDWSGA